MSHFSIPTVAYEDDLQPGSFGFRIGDGCVLVPRRLYDLLHFQCVKQGAQLMWFLGKYPDEIREELGWSHDEYQRAFAEAKGVLTVETVGEPIEWVEAYGALRG